ncbi:MULTISPECIES: hypothetical protein [unclassified Mesorhizobium]|uniref:hypothetical protein n=1 Tax=unclassified Mesorhizobium TaxID=325217 RepID=UPI003339C548
MSTMFSTLANRPRERAEPADGTAAIERPQFSAAGLVLPLSRHYSPAMIACRSSSILRFAAVAIAGTNMLVGTAFAQDSSTSSQKGALPGVTSDYRIAEPAPQPEPDDAVPSSGNGTSKIGDTDVRISGSITIDVATGGIRPSSR